MRMSGRVGIVAVALVLGSTLALAQSDDPPTPGPEQEALGVWVGNWTIEVESQDSPFGPAGSSSRTRSCDWYEGRFAVVCESEGTSSTGEQGKELEILTYDTYQQAYVLYEVNSLGPVRLPAPTITVEGDTWTFTGDMEIEGRSVSLRATIMVTSPMESTQISEISENGGPWTKVGESTATKTQ